MTATSVKYELLMQVVLLYKSIFSLNFKNSQKVSIPVGNLLSSGIHTTVLHPTQVQASQNCQGKQENEPGRQPCDTHGNSYIGWVLHSLKMKLRKILKE